MEPEPSASRLPLVVMAAVVALAILVAVAFGLRGTAEYEPGTPESALQDFLNAALDGDNEALAAMVTPDRRDGCAATGEGVPFRRTTGISFELDEVRVEDDTANAAVTMRSRRGDDPFGGTRRRGGYEFTLNRVDGVWLIHKADWPWSVRNCTDDEQ